MQNLPEAVAKLKMQTKKQFASKGLQGRACHRTLIQASCCYINQGIYIQLIPSFSCCVRGVWLRQTEAPGFGVTEEKESSLLFPFTLKGIFSIQKPRGKWWDLFLKLYYDLQLMSNMAHLNITTLPAFAVSKLTYKGVLNEKIQRISF